MVQIQNNLTVLFLIKHSTKIVQNGTALLNKGAARDLDKKYI